MSSYVTDGDEPAKGARDKKKKLPHEAKKKVSKRRAAQFQRLSASDASALPLVLARFQNCGSKFNTKWLRRGNIKATTVTTHTVYRQCGQLLLQFFYRQ